jgi:hypothetical protein
VLCISLNRLNIAQEKGLGFGDVVKRTLSHAAALEASIHEADVKAFETKLGGITTMFSMVHGHEQLNMVGG